MIQRAVIGLDRLRQALRPIEPWSGVLATACGWAGMALVWMRVPDPGIALSLFALLSMWVATRRDVEGERSDRRASFSRSFGRSGRSMEPILYWGPLAAVLYMMLIVMIWSFGGLGPRMSVTAITLFLAGMALGLLYRRRSPVAVAMPALAALVLIAYSG